MGKKFESPLSRIVLAFALDFICLVLICFFYKYNLFLGSLLMLIFFACCWLWPDFIPAMLIGALFGAIGEIVCVNYNFWIYAAPSFLKIPWWIPVIWSILFVTFCQLALIFDEYLKSVSLSPYQRIVIIPLNILIIIYTLYTAARIHRIIAIVYLIFFILICVFGHTSFNTLLFVIGSLGGTLGEVICMRAHVWYYTRPIFSSIGVPLSLPLAWGLSINIIYLIGKPLIIKARKKLKSVE